MTILTVAAGMDLAVWRIRNWLIAGSLILGYACQVCVYQTQTSLTYLASIMLPVIMLYLLFLMHALGAGDIKLLSVTGAFLGIRGGFTCILYSFVIGAAISAMKMIGQRNLVARLAYLRSYISLSLATRTFHDYDRHSDGKENRIHFSVCILFGTILYLGVNQ